MVERLMLVSLLALSACRGAHTQPVMEGGGVVDEPESEPESEAMRAEIERAAAGVENGELRTLLEQHWRANLQRNTGFAMRLGIFDAAGQWPARGSAVRAAQSLETETFLAAAKRLDRAGLSEADQLTLDLFVGELESARAREVCEFWAWSVSSRNNPLARIAGFAELVKADSPENIAALRQRYASFVSVVDAEIADLRDGLSRGLVGDADSIARAQEMLERELALAPEASSLLGPVAELDAADPLRVELHQRLVEDIRPALERYAQVLKQELSVAARGEGAVGIGALPQGAACYAALIQHHTSETPSADELHELGLAEIARIDEEFRVLGARELGTGELAQVLERLRTDPALYFASSEEVETFARETLAAAEAAAPEWFGRLPQTPCEVQPIPDYEAPYTTIAYYRQPGEGTPGTYFINTYAPSTRPRYEARVLAIHEAVPGHHTQVSLAQELPDAPAFRRHGGTTVFVEGWALYTERLADEMGLYESDLDRLGVLSFDAWRASRLVVDTGIHAKGWTRQQAVDFMLAHTALAENNIVNEVDRYVGWPGQALAYKYGQLEFLRLRAEAMQALGDGFEISAFHDLVLGAGAVSLPILRGRVRAWIDARVEAGPAKE